MKKQGKGIVKTLKNNKGQALVEFVILLPIIILILFIIIDFANVFYNKNHLESTIDDISIMITNGLTKEEIDNHIDNKNINYEVSIKDGYATITVEEKISFITPFSNYIFKDDYKIKTKKVIIYE